MLIDMHPRFGGILEVTRAINPKVDPIIDHLSHMKELENNKNYSDHIIVETYFGWLWLPLNVASFVFKRKESHNDPIFKMYLFFANFAHQATLFP